MTADQLAGIAGIVLSLVFSYVPGIRERFDALDSQYKQAIMGALLIVVAASIFGVACAGLVDVGVTCTEEGAIQFVYILIAALVSNQSVYLITSRD